MNRLVTLVWMVGCGLTGADDAKADMTRLTLMQQGSQLEMAALGSDDGTVSPPSNLPTDGWDRPLTFVAGTEGKPFDLFSLGADGKPGGEGVDADIRYRELLAE